MTRARPSHPAHRAALLVATAVLLMACTGQQREPTGAPSASPGTQPPQPVPAVAVASLPPGSDYLVALCARDLLPPADSDDLLGELAENLRQLPADTAEEGAEAARLADLVARADDGDDIDALLEVGAILGARCG